jgi:hypothetical protein
MIKEGENYQPDKEMLDRWECDERDWANKSLPQIHDDADDDQNVVEKII